MNNLSKIKKIVYISLFAALIAAGAVITIPLGPVPMSLQTLFVFLAALFLGPKLGTLSVFIYLLAGAVGLPVFSGGSGGMGRFLGPTGGYLIGFLLAAFLVGFISSLNIFKKKKEKFQIYLDIIAMIIGTAAVYVLGVFWLKIATGMTLQKAFYIGALPFFIGDALKIAAGAFIIKKLRSFI
jgi:biotin transport system substrate-specific component